MGTRTLITLIFLLLPFGSVYSQATNSSLSETHHRIRKAVDAGEIQTAITELRTLRDTDASAFSANNFDYLLGRLSERAGDAAGAQAGYESVASRNSLLTSHAVWRLAQLARSSGDLVLERERLRQFLISTSPNQLREVAILRLGESFWESGDLSAVPGVLRPLISSTNKPLAREAMTLTGRSVVTHWQNLGSTRPLCSSSDADA